MLINNNNSPAEKSPLFGVIFIISMTICFSTLDASAKYIVGDFPLFMVLWGRYLFHFLFVVLFFIRRAPRDILSSKRISLQILRSILLFGAGLTFWGALKFMPLADCVVIAFASPFLVIVLSVPFLGERFSVHRLGAVIVGLVGVTVVLRPGIGILQWTSLLPLVAALFYSNTLIITRILGRTDSALTTLFYTGIGGFIFSSIAVFFVWVQPSIVQWLSFVLMGFLGALGHYFMFKAFEISPASMLAPFEYSSLIWATIYGFLLFNDFPDFWTILGAVIIISSGLYVIRREKVLIT